MRILTIDIDSLRPDHLSGYGCLRQAGRAHHAAQLERFKGNPLTTGLQ